MNSRPLGIAALALGIMGAAGVGSYLALRPTQPAAAQVVSSGQVQSGQLSGQPTQPASGAAVPQNPVAETEGAVAPDSKTPPAAQPVEAPKAAAADPAPATGSAAAVPAASSKKAAKNEPGRHSGGRAPVPVATTASREPYAPGGGTPPSGSYVQGAYRPASENPANPPQALPQQPPVEQAPPPEPAAPPKPRFEELQIPADSVIGLRLEDTISSETARVEDRIEARVSRDVRVNGELAIPAGTRARGNVALVESGGKFKERARLGVRFHTLVLADGSTIPIQTETIYRDGAEVSRQSATKIGAGAAAGALIGAIFGGGKGAAIGAAAGGGAGTAAAAAGPRSQAVLPAGSTVTVRLSSPAAVTIEK